MVAGVMRGWNVGRCGAEILGSTYSGNHSGVRHAKVQLDQGVVILQTLADDTAVPAAARADALRAVEALTVGPKNPVRALRTDPNGAGDAVRTAHTIAGEVHALAEPSYTARIAELDALAKRLDDAKAELDAGALLADVAARAARPVATA